MRREATDLLGGADRSADAAEAKHGALWTNAGDDVLAVAHAALQQGFREWSFELLLNRPLQWTGAIVRLVADASDVLDQGLIQFERDVTRIQPPAQQFELDIDDATELLALQNLEYD